MQLVLALFLSFAQAACSQGGASPKRKVEAYVLMPLADFVATNEGNVRDLPQSVSDAPVITVEIDEPTAFVYTDPRDRFDLSFKAVGGPANTFRIMISRGIRLGLDKPAIMYMEFAQSDGAALDARLAEAIALHDGLAMHGFTSTDDGKFQRTIDGVALNDFRELRAHVDTFEVPVGGIHLFTLQRDELLIDASLLRQAATWRNDDYALYFVIREKTMGVED